MEDVGCDVTPFLKVISFILITFQRSHTGMQLQHFVSVKVVETSCSMTKHALPPQIYYRLVARYAVQATIPCKFIGQNVSACCPISKSQL